MKHSLLIFLTLFLANQIFSQFGSGYFFGEESICVKDKYRRIKCYDSPRKWFHENQLSIKNDTFFLYKVPFHKVKNKRLFSAADGGFYYYLGIPKFENKDTFIYFHKNNCDYCARHIKIDSSTWWQIPVIEIEKLKYSKTKDGFKIGDVEYQKYLKEGFFFTNYENFYFDSSSIKNSKPFGMYALINKAILNFIQTGDLKAANNTIYISTDRLDRNEVVEKLNKENFKIDTSNLNFIYLSKSELEVLGKKEIVRYIEIDRIEDYYYSSYISIRYKILLPKSIRNFEEREYHNAFNYCKKGYIYTLKDKIYENSWSLVQQK